MFRKDKNVWKLHLVEELKESEQAREKITTTTKSLQCRKQTRNRRKRNWMCS